MTLVWWLCSDASWGNYDFYDFYWSFWIITIDTQQVILFYTELIYPISCISSLGSSLLLVFRLPLSSPNRVSPRADKISIFISLSKFLIWFVRSVSNYNYNPSWLLTLCWQQLVMTACSAFWSREVLVFPVFILFWTTIQISGTCCFGDITSRTSAESMVLSVVV